MKVSRNFFSGKKISGEIPGCIYEHIIAEAYGWEPDVIRNMDAACFRDHLHVCLGRRMAEQEFQMALAGFSNKKKSMKSVATGKSTVKQKFNPEINDFEKVG